MTTRRGCFFLVCGLFAVLVLGAGIFFVLNQAALSRLEELQVMNASPDIYISSPGNGMAFRPGAIAPVEMTALGPHPIERVELWLDGEKIGEQINAELQEATTFHAVLPLQILEGDHMLVARAVDTEAVVGQSLPINIYGDPQLLTLDIDTQLLVQEGQSAEDVVNVYGIDSNAFQEAFPALPSGSLPLDTQLVLPSNVTGGSPSLPSSENTQNNQSANIEVVDETLLLADPNALPLNQPVLFSADVDPKAPAAPSNLQAVMLECKLLLTWQDNAVNEQVYTVWMSDFLKPGRQIAVLQPAPSPSASYLIDIPPAGPYGLWVEAVNYYGKQASEIAWLRIPNHDCTSLTPRDLEFEFVLLDIATSWDRLYCYVSVEGQSNVRIPPQEDTFYYSTSSSQNSGPTKNIIPIPPDGELNLDGKCMLWNQGTLIELGTFSESIPRSDWDGELKTMRVGNANFTYRIQPIGGNLAHGQFAFLDNSLSAPTYLTVSTPDLTAENYGKVRLLRWGWEGTEAIDGFSIIVRGGSNGVVQQVSPQVRSALVWVPSRCADTVTFEVRATQGSKQSMPAYMAETQPACPIQVTVEFLDIELQGVDDMNTNPFVFYTGGSCRSDPFDVYFSIWASFGQGIVRKSYYDNSNIVIAMNCGVWPFSTLFFPPRTADKYTFEGFLEASSTGYANLGFGTLFMDHDELSPDDVVANVSTVLYESLEDWDGFDTIYTFPFQHPDSFGNLRVRVIGERISP